MKVEFKFKFPNFFISKIMNLSSIIIPEGECKYRPSITCYPINIKVKHQTFYKHKSAVITNMYKIHIKIVVVNLKP